MANGPVIVVMKLAGLKFLGETVVLVFFNRPDAKITGLVPAVLFKIQAMHCNKEIKE